MKENYLSHLNPMLKSLKSPSEDLFYRIEGFLSTYPLRVAGRVLTFDSGINSFVLCMHATSPEKTEEATQNLFDALPEDIKRDLKHYNIGFAGKQI